MIFLKKSVSNPFKSVCYPECKAFHLFKILFKIKKYNKTFACANIWLRRICVSYLRFHISYLSCPLAKYHNARFFKPLLPLVCVFWVLLR
jgi:hypothetical protein